MYLVSSYRGEPPRTIHNTTTQQRKKPASDLHNTKPNRWEYTTHILQSPHEQNAVTRRKIHTPIDKQLHETKAPNQKYAIVTRNPQQCANRKQRDPRNLQQKSRFQLPESKPFKHHSAIAMVPHRARRRRTNRHNKKRKEERRNEERKRPWLFHPIQLARRDLEPGVYIPFLLTIYLLTWAGFIGGQDGRWPRGTSSIALRIG